jgi:hypothetical protein
MAQVEMQRELRPARRFLGAALEGKFQAFGERVLFFDGWHRKIVPLSHTKEDNHPSQL